MEHQEDDVGSRDANNGTRILEGLGLELGLHNSFSQSSAVFQSWKRPEALGLRREESCSEPHQRSLHVKCAGSYLGSSRWPRADRTR